MFKYATAEAILARLHGARGDTQRNAFRGRLKHLKRLGIPRGVSPGRGSKVWYEERHVYEWAFCLELAECGLDPSVIANFIERHWDEVLPNFVMAAAAITVPMEIKTYFIAWPLLMEKAWAPKKEALKFKFVTADALNVDVPRRAIIINISQLILDFRFYRPQLDEHIAEHELENWPTDDGSR